MGVTMLADARDWLARSLVLEVEKGDVGARRGQLRGESKATGREGGLSRNKKRGVFGWVRKVWSMGICDFRNEVCETCLRWMMQRHMRLWHPFREAIFAL